MQRLFASALACASIAGCVDPQAAFIGGRLKDPCNAAWPVCTTSAGCVIGNEYYLEGRFPGTRRMVVRTQSRAKVAIVVLLLFEGATGKETRFTWNEVGCGSAFTEAVDGREFFKEYDAAGEFRRERDLYKMGDHLIEVSSDSTAEYLLKLEVSEPDLK